MSAGAATGEHHLGRAAVWRVPPFLQPHLHPAGLHAGAVHCGSGPPHGLCWHPQQPVRLGVQLAPHLIAPLIGQKQHTAGLGQRPMAAQQGERRPAHGGAADCGCGPASWPPTAPVMRGALQLKTPQAATGIANPALSSYPTSAAFMGWSPCGCQPLHGLIWQPVGAATPPQTRATMPAMKIPAESQRPRLCCGWLVEHQVKNARLRPCNNQRRMVTIR